MSSRNAPTALERDEEPDTLGAPSEIDAAAASPTESADAETSTDEPAHGANAPRFSGPSEELFRSLGEVRGQAQFLLYLADQIEESLQQFADESDEAHTAFLCKILGMYSTQLETKYQNLGERIAETCQEVYVTVREVDAG